MTAPAPILIAGGGIGGLATAIACARVGIASTVIEREAAPREAGAGIQLGPNAVKVLRRLGVAEPVAHLASAPAELTVRRTRDGSTVTRTPLGSWAAQRYGAPYWTIHRADLHQVLLDAAAALPNIHLIRGFELAAVDQTTDAVTAQATDGRTITAPLLIGADGVWSRVRDHIAPGTAPRPSGYVAYRTVLPVVDASSLARDAVSAWLSPSAHIVHYPVHAGRDLNIVIIADSAWQGTTWNAPASSAEITTLTNAFHTTLRSPLTSATTTWHKWSLTSPLSLPSWHQGRIALLGDAAHPILPFLAQGGAMALEDASALATSLSAHKGNTLAALTAYQLTRQPRVDRVATQSKQNGQIFHLPTPLAVARDLALKALPATHPLTRLDWLYGYEPASIA